MKQTQQTHQYVPARQIHLNPILFRSQHRIPRIVPKIRAHLDAPPITKLALVGIILESGAHVEAILHRQPLPSAARSFPAALSTRTGLT